MRQTPHRMAVIYAAYGYKQKRLEDKIRLARMSPKAKPVKAQK